MANGLDAALKLHADTACKANDVQIIPDPLNRDRYWLRKPDGTVSSEYEFPKRRQQTVESLHALVDLAKQEMADYEEAEPQIWHSKDRIVLYFNRSTRFETATMPLTLDRRYQLLANFEQSPKKFTHADFLVLLRTQFADSIADSKLMPLLRNLKFRRTDNSDSNLQHGNESLGRQVQRQVAGATELPEQVVFELPVNEEFSDQTWPIRCALVVNLTDETFSLIPLAGELKNAADSQQQLLAAHLEKLLDEAGIKEKTPVVYGRP